MSGSTTTFNYTGQIISYTVPVTGSYEIVAIGASGGSGYQAAGKAQPSDSVGGLGGDVAGDIQLIAGEVLEIAVGGEGVNVAQFVGSGGGASFVVEVGTTLTPLVIAGGGGGGSGYTFGANGGNAGGIASSGFSGGAAGRSVPKAGEYGGGGGGGLLGNGGPSIGGGAGGASFADGAAGGLGYGGGVGGFGGGGGDGYGGGGGGGGYGGGAGGDAPILSTPNEGAGAGGSSFDSGTNQTFALAGAPGNGVVTIELLCFLGGTRILTPTGDVVVEALSIGDLVTITDGRAAPVRWIGRQTVCRTFADPLRVLPIRIKAGALAKNVPSRDLLLSPCHAVLVNNVLIQAGALVNGTSIVRETRIPETFVYYHVELDDHALILAEGAPSETFIDNVDRMAFDNWDEHLALYPEGHAIKELPFPRAQSHRQVSVAIRRMLSARADAMTNRPALAA